MEEAEALCPKMGIMVDGKFQCFGSAQHIKDKYADGFDIDVKIAEMSDGQMSKYFESLGEDNSWEGDSFVYEREAQIILQDLGMGQVWERHVTDQQDLKQVLRQDSPFRLQEVLKWAHIEYRGLLLI